MTIQPNPSRREWQVRVPANEGNGTILTPNNGMVTVYQGDLWACLHWVRKHTGKSYAASKP